MKIIRKWLQRLKICPVGLDQEASDTMDVYPRYFAPSELLQSETALQKGISNLPSAWEVLDSLKELAFFLDDLREEWGSGIIVTSGYRCDELNEAVGGVSNSEHRLGTAADLRPANGKMYLFKQFVVNYLKDKKYNQCILEKSGGVEWVHLSIKAADGSQKCQCFKIEK